MTLQLFLWEPSDCSPIFHSDYDSGGLSLIPKILASIPDYNCRQQFRGKKWKTKVFTEALA